jgi:hypothetical protein
VQEFFVTAPILGLYSYSEEYAIWVSTSAGSGSQSVFSGVFIAEEVDGVGDGVRRYHNS